MILRPAAAPEPDLELFLIKRAEHPLDPWSGHMAFPGGHREEGDPDLEHAARRETLEEVGIDLSGALALGRLPDVTGAKIRPGELAVTPFVYYLPPGLDSVEPLPNGAEVAATVWVPLAHLTDPANVIPYYYPPDPERRPFPSFRFRDYTIWGMTYRMIRDFVDLLGSPLPGGGPVSGVE